MANQQNLFIPDFAHHTRFMREFLGKSCVFCWLPDHQVDFEKVKSILSEKLLTFHFDPSLPVQLLTDASRHHGLDYALCQPCPDSYISLITCGSKALTPTQQCYATVELECLGILWAVWKCEFYLKGLPNSTCLLYTSPSPRD